MDNTTNNGNNTSIPQRDIPRLIHDDDRMREALRKAAEVAEHRRTTTTTARKLDNGKR